MKNNSTQISIFFIIVIATLIAITFVTVNIGKIALDKTYSGNATDGSALSGASAMAYAFNYVANANAGDGDKTFKKNWEKFDQAVTKYVQNTSKLYMEYTQLSSQAQSKTCCFSIVLAPELAQKAYDKIGKKAGSGKGTGFIGQVNELIKNAWPEANSEDDQKENDIGLIPNYAHLQESFYKAVRERVQDDNEGQNDIYHNALYLGYMYNFNNSGISHRLGKINQKQYSAFLEEIKPETVRSGEAKTFSWVDGAGRAHTVTAIVNIQDALNYKVVETVENRQQIKEKLDEAMQLAEEAKMDVQNAINDYQTAVSCIPYVPCTSIPGCSCPENDASGDLQMQEADMAMQEAISKVLDARAGLRKGDSKSSSKKDDTNKDIICYIEDIEHDRQVESSNFQFHMGSPVKGMRGDIDIMTAYPPVFSDSTASFQGNGDIENGQASHDASLVSAQ
ncbi:MAG: pilus assembly protein TadG-related protein [Candidatus Omnitrophica bacterium]|jgi:hypothetical protein|nr:pilus assembly protein TadG-related protein [Candidatus Omnitrophota bacterium]